MPTGSIPLIGWAVVDAEIKRMETIEQEKVETSLPSLFSGALTPKDIERIEIEFLSKKQVDCPVYHRFGPGIYIREVHAPAGSIIIGHHQAKEHLNIMLKGRIALLEGGRLREEIAPTMFTAQPGRKIAYIYENMVWQNIYATPETDVEKLEAEFLVKSDPWKENNDMQNSMAKLGRIADRDDYPKALREFGISHEDDRRISEDESDLVAFPYGGYTVMVSESFIEGKGLFATAPFDKGETICPARIGGKRTPAGRYVNHSKNPNAVIVRHENGDISLVAIQAVQGCVGGYLGDELTVDYRQALGFMVNPIAGGGGVCQE